MTLSSYRMHRIYLAATMGYGLGSDDPEELAYYKKLRKEMDDMKTVSYTHLTLPTKSTV